MSTHCCLPLKYPCTPCLVVLGRELRYQLRSPACTFMPKSDLLATPTATEGSQINSTSVEPWRLSI
jgi:hypothetical protein